MHKSTAANSLIRTRGPSQPVPSRQVPEVSFGAAVAPFAPAPLPVLGGWAVRACVRECACVHVNTSESVFPFESCPVHRAPGRAGGQSRSCHPLGPGLPVGAPGEQKAPDGPGPRAPAQEAVAVQRPRFPPGSAGRRPSWFTRGRGWCPAHSCSSGEIRERKRNLDSQPGRQGCWAAGPGAGGEGRGSTAQGQCFLAGGSCREGVPWAHHVPCHPDGPAAVFSGMVRAPCLGTGLWPPSRPQGHFLGRGAQPVAGCRTCHGDLASCTELSREGE